MSIFKACFEKHIHLPRFSTHTFIMGCFDDISTTVLRFSVSYTEYEYGIYDIQLIPNIPLDGFTSIKIRSERNIPLLIWNLKNFEVLVEKWKRCRAICVTECFYRIPSSWGLAPPPHIHNLIPVISPRNVRNNAPCRGFVRMSASICPVGKYSLLISFASM